MIAAYSSVWMFIRLKAVAWGFNSHGFDLHSFYPVFLQQLKF